MRLPSFFKVMFNKVVGSSASIISKFGAIFLSFIHLLLLEKNNSWIVAVVY